MTSKGFTVDNSIKNVLKDEKQQSVTNETTTQDMKLLKIK